MQNTSKDGWKRTPSNGSKVLVRSEEETLAFAREWSQGIECGQVILLEGDIGAGKTTFVKGLAQGKGLDADRVTSPTFQYLQVYRDIAHFDLYRIEDEEQFLAMGFDEYLGGEYITCIEWPSRIEKIYEDQWVRIEISHTKEGREICVQGANR